MAFFGSLGERANAVLDQFGDDELATIDRFITAMADSVHEHVTELDRGRRGFKELPVIVILPPPVLRR